MGIFDGINEKTKSISVLANLKRKILYEEDRINEILHEVGRLHYNGLDDNCEQIQIHCDDIEDRKRRIRHMKKEYFTIRGHKQCPICHAEVALKYKFCGECGARFDEFMNNNPSYSSYDDFAAATAADEVKQQG